MMTPLRCCVVRCCTKRNLKICVTGVRNSSTETAEPIVIPPRINRGPTDILKALASTITRDSTAPHYKYHDDPYLIPYSNMGKRTFALAKESGRKAARWIQDQHPDLFRHSEADPFIEVFAPRTVPNEDSEVDEDMLKAFIKEAQVTHAITVYQLLEKKGQEITNDTKQSFLELLCFFNCEDPVPEEHLEERWFWQSAKGREKQRKTWKDNSLAEKVFLSFEQKNSAVYCALIQGMTRYCQVDRAWELYEESQEKNLVLCADTYNYLIRMVNFLRESTDLRWKLVQDLLMDMVKHRLQPNVGTLNSILEALSTMPNVKQTKSYALKTLSEFKMLEIEPTLASYYFLLITFCKERGPVSNILVDIMKHIQGKEFSIQDPKDTYFFVTAMDICRHHLQDKELAYRVNELLNTGNNYVLIGDSYKESIYYRHFFMLICATEPLDVFMNLYHRLVPHVYIPEPAVMEDVIKTIDMNGAIEHLPQIWTDMVVFDHTDRENSVSALLSSMVRNVPPEESDLVLQFGNIAWDIWTRTEDFEEDRYRKWRWTGNMLGDVMTLLLRADNYANACVIMDKLNNAQHEIVGLPQVNALQLYLDTCVQEMDVKRGIACIQYCADAAFPEIEQMAKNFISSLPVDESMLQKLSNIVGKDLRSKEQHSDG